MAVEHSVRLPERYRVTRRIASGGMATVYACEDQTLGRLVAVKVLAPAFATDEDALARFQREARAVARVSDHPHVVTIYDIGEHEGAAFIVMEYFAGGTLADRLRTGDPIPRPTSLAWLEEAASALDHAHRAGIVHRDVKPANLLLDANGRLAVGDFGIARMATDVGVTSTGTVLGTAAYLSPEQALGHSATPASDRYALAAVAYELLTGHRPFQAEHPAAQARAHVETPPPASGLSTAVDQALWRGLDKEPDSRWPTAGELVDALEEALGEEAEPTPVPATAPTAPVRRRPEPAPVAAAAAPAAAPRRRRSWGPVLIAALVVGLLAGGVIAALIGGGGGNGATTTAAKRKTPTTTQKAAAPAAASTKTATQPAAAQPTQTQAAQTTDASTLEQRGHALVTQGNYDQAIPMLTQAAKDCPVSRTDPCAFALYDLGHALRLAGRPAEAVPVLQKRLQNPNQLGVVQAELDKARAEAGQGDAKPGNGPKKGKKPKD
jgi:serine/threonine-protein kinase